MWRFFDIVISPVISAIKPDVIVEIGALNGKNSVQLAKICGAKTELHVIDPKLRFDAEKLAKEVPGRFVFHQDTSLNVIPELPPFDIGLIDGDHNWYTVYHELQAIQRLHTDEEKFPV